jgi:diaminopimelate epimerase
MIDRTQITVESFGKIKYLTLYPVNGLVERVRVNMGPAILEASEVPVRCEAEEGKALDLPDGSRISCAAVEMPIEIDGKTCPVTCVSMGNPHAVLYVDRTDDLPLTEIGPLFEHHERFPNRINTEFVEVLDRGHVKMRVWERGSGETWACGTGACATAVAAILNGYGQSPVRLHLNGGDLLIEWDRDTNHVFMTGPAEEVFEGEWKQ